MPAHRNTPERIVSMLVPAENGCLIWPSALSRKGYGRTSIRHENHHVHRVVWEHLIGPIPEGLEPDHLCRNKACSNVEHLELVTRRENLLRGTSPMAINAQKTECHRSHPFTEENTYLDKCGRRHCRTCQRERQSGYRAARRAALAYPDSF